MARYNFAGERSPRIVEDGKMKRAIWSFQLERGLPVMAGTIREIAAEPMQAYAMGSGTFNAIHYNPEVVLEKKYGSPVSAAARMSLVAVVLAYAESPISVVLESQ